MTTSISPPPPHLAEAPRRPTRRVATALLTICLLAAGLTIAADTADGPAASAEHVRSKKQGNVKDSEPTLWTPSRWKDGNYGYSGFNGFKYTTRPKTHAVWDFGYLRGRYSMHVVIPNKVNLARKVLGGRDANPLATGRAYYQVQESVGNGQWKTVEGSGFVLNQAKWANKETWRRIDIRLGTSKTVELDGRTRVLVRMSNRSSRGDIIVADSFELRRIGYLQEDINFAITDCKNDVLRVIVQREKIESTADYVLDLADLAIDTVQLGAAVYTLNVPGAALKGAQVVLSASEVVESLERLKEVQQAFKDSDSYDNLSAELRNEIIDSLGLQATYDQYYRGCNSRDGVNWWNDLFSIFVPDGWEDYMDDGRHYEDKNLDIESTTIEDLESGNGDNGDDPPPPPPPTVSLIQTRVDAVLEGKCRNSCTWQQATVSGFPPGTYRVRCFTYNTYNRQPVEYTNNNSYYTITVGSNGTGQNSKVCWNGIYNDVARYSANVYVTVGGYTSNIITLARPLAPAAPLTGSR